MYDKIAGAFILTPESLEEIDFRKLASPNPALGFLAAYVNKNWGYKLNDYCDESELAQLEEILTRGGLRHNSYSVGTDEKNYFLKITGSAKELILMLRRLRRGRYSTANDLRGFITIFFGEKIANLCADFSVKIFLKFRIFTGDGEISI
jgi:hypothetical protein